MPKKNAFTLIELLVVIAIIALLLSILIPSLKVAKQYATAAVCLSNLNGLSKGWYLYADDNDGKIVGGYVDNNINPDNSWVERPQPDSAGLEEKERAIKDGAMFTYVEATKLYHCLGDRRYLKPPVRGGSAGVGYGGYRSYSIVGGLKGVGNGKGSPGWWVYPHMTIGGIRSPGSKYVFVEEADGRGVNMGSWVLDPRPPGGWVDPLTIWHNGRSTLGFCDGHAERMIWRDKSTFDMSEDQKFYQTLYPEDSGEDLRYMVRNYPFDRPDGW